MCWTYQSGTANRNSYVFSYDCLNHIRDVSKDGNLLARYSYSTDGTKLSAVNASGDGLVYIGSMVYTRKNGILEFDSAPFSQGRIVSCGTGIEPHYFIIDHLGSVRVEVDYAGSIVETNDYYPSGTKWTDTSGSQPSLASYTNRYRYNGKEEQGFLGLPYIDYGARMYNPENMLSWLSADELAEKYYSISPYSFCAGNPVNIIDPDGKAWQVLYYKNKPCGYEWVPEEDAYKSNGQLKAGLYHQAIFFSKNEYFDLEKNIGSSTAYVYLANGEIVTYRASTTPSKVDIYPTIPEKVYEAKVGIHNRKYEALRLSDTGTRNFYANKIELGYENPAYSDGRTFAQGINIHKAGDSNRTGMTRSTNSGISQGCILIDVENWKSFLSNFNSSAQRKNTISVTVSRSFAEPIKYILPPPISIDIKRQF